MAQRSLRFPDDVHAAIEAEAKARDRSFSYIVVDALRCHLRVPAAVASVPVAAETAARPAGVRGGAAPVVRETAAMARQRKLNEAKGGKR